MVIKLKLTPEIVTAIARNIDYPLYPYTDEEFYSDIQTVGRVLTSIVFQAALHLPAPYPKPIQSCMRRELTYRYKPARRLPKSHRATSPQ